MYLLFDNEIGEVSQSTIIPEGSGEEVSAGALCVFRFNKEYNVFEEMDEYGKWSSVELE